TVIVARPPPEPQPAASTAETASASARALAIPVRTREAAGEQIDKDRGREADHVQVVALDPLDERGPEALDRIAAGTIAPLLAHDVEAELPRGQRPERHAGDCVPHLFPRGSQQAKTRDDLVRAARQLLQHGLGLGRTPRLAVDASFEHDLCIDAENRLVV